MPRFTRTAEIDSIRLALDTLSFLVWGQGNYEWIHGIYVSSGGTVQGEKKIYNEN